MNWQNRELFGIGWGFMDQLLFFLLITLLAFCLAFLIKLIDFFIFRLEFFIGSSPPPQKKEEKSLRRVPIFFEILN